MSYDIDAVMDCGGPDPISVTGGWNYTYNVSPMLRLAFGGNGINDLHGKSAGEAATLIYAVVQKMAADPASYRALNPENGWGCFDGEDGIKHRLFVLAEQLESVPLAKVVVW